MNKATFCFSLKIFYLKSSPCGSAVTSPIGVSENMGFDPWPCSVNWGSDVASGYGVGGSWVPGIAVAVV